jgi:hypothetical protein
MEDELENLCVPISPEIALRVRLRITEILQELCAWFLAASDVAVQGGLMGREDSIPLDRTPKKDRPPVATFSELLFEKSERSAHVMPSGLRIALLALSKLDEVPAADVNELVADIHQNLDWADAELRSCSVTVYTFRYGLQLEMAREQVVAFEPRPKESRKVAASN